MRHPCFGDSLFYTLRLGPVHRLRGFTAWRINESDGAFRPIPSRRARTGAGPPAWNAFNGVGTLRSGRYSEDQETGKPPFRLKAVLVRLGVYCVGVVEVHFRQLFSGL